MKSLEEIINASKDVREVKRALSVKMALRGVAPVQISEWLNVSPQYVSKWKVKYEAEGAGALQVGYQGSQGYLGEEQRQEIVDWIGRHETLTVEQIRDYVGGQWGVTYQSKQSYYDLLQAGGMSYHRSEKINPKRDETEVLTRREDIKKNWRHIGPRSSGVK